MPSVPLIEMDGAGWQVELDFYKSLADVLGSPAWHGLNADAFEETMVYYTDTNVLRPPYKLVIIRSPSHLRQFLLKFADWIAVARQSRISDANWGDDVRVEVVVK